MATLLRDQGLISDHELNRICLERRAKIILIFMHPSFIPHAWFASSRIEKVSNGDGPKFGLPVTYGVNGRIVDVCGKFGDPPFLSFGIETPKTWLHRVVR
mmetsp:Transcript_116120/g.237502  ORF Transcript_116120/g.237502 Transcript_116120/m.237502 type:complete len:100 (+) Transcript_116120:488-787(+)